MERRAARGLALDSDAPAMCFSDPAPDREPEPRAAVSARSRAVHAVEAVEDVRQVLRRDADAGVADSADDGTLLRAHRDRQRTAGGRVLDRVVEQDQEQSA